MTQMKWKVRKMNPKDYKEICDSIFYCPRCKERLRLLESLKHICLSCGFVFSIRIEDRLINQEKKEKKENGQCYEA